MTRVTRQLLEAALAVAKRRGVDVRGLDVRLGARATSTPARLRETFENEVQHRGLSPITLTVAVDRRHPGGVDVVGVNLSETGPSHGQCQDVRLDARSSCERHSVWGEVAAVVRS